jgi:hypothetical protein
MGVPTSEVGYTLATPGRGVHEVHKGYVVALGGKKQMLIAFPLQQWLHEGASMLRYTYIACLLGDKTEGSFQIS